MTTTFINNIKGYATSIVFLLKLGEWDSASFFPSSYCVLEEGRKLKQGQSSSYSPGYRDCRQSLPAVVF